MMNLDLKKWRERKPTYVSVPENADTGVRQNCTFRNKIKGVSSSYLPVARDEDAVAAVVECPQTQ